MNNKSEHALLHQGSTSHKKKKKKKDKSHHEVDCKKGIFSNSLETNEQYNEINNVPKRKKHKKHYDQNQNINNESVAESNAMDIHDNSLVIKIENNVTTDEQKSNLEVKKKHKKKKHRKYKDLDSGECTSILGNNYDSTTQEVCSPVQSSDLNIPPLKHKKKKHQHEGNSYSNLKDVDNQIVQSYADDKVNRNVTFDAENNSEKSSSSPYKKHHREKKHFPLENSSYSSEMLPVISHKSMNKCKSMQEFKDTPFTNKILNHTPNQINFSTSAELNILNSNSTLPKDAYLDVSGKTPMFQKLKKHKKKQRNSEDKNFDENKLSNEDIQAHFISREKNFMSNEENVNYCNLNQNNESVRMNSLSKNSHSSNNIPDIDRDSISTMLLLHDADNNNEKLKKKKKRKKNKQLDNLDDEKQDVLEPNCNFPSQEVCLQEQKDLNIKPTKHKKKKHKHKDSGSSKFKHDENNEIGISSSNYRKSTVDLNISSDAKVTSDNSNELYCENLPKEIKRKKKKSKESNLNEENFMLKNDCDLPLQEICSSTQPVNMDSSYSKHKKRKHQHNDGISIESSENNKITDMNILLDAENDVRSTNKITLQKTPIIRTMSNESLTESNCLKSQKKIKKRKYLVEDSIQSSDKQNTDKLQNGDFIDSSSNKMAKFSESNEQPLEMGKKEHIHKKKGNHKDKSLDTDSGCETGLLNDKKQDKTSVINDVIYLPNHSSSQKASENIHPTNEVVKMLPSRKRIKQVSKSWEDCIDFEEDIPNFEIPRLHKCEKVSFLNAEESTKLKKEGIKIRKGQFTKQEHDIIIRNWNNFIRKYNIDDAAVLLGINTRRFKNQSIMKFIKAKHFYVRLAQDLNDRTLYSVYKHARSVLDPNKTKIRFSPEEINKLLYLNSIHGNDWVKISSLMDKTTTQCFTAFRTHSKEHKTSTWSEKEIKRFNKAISSICDSDEKIRMLASQRCGVPWERIASIVKTRNSFQCRTYWKTHWAEKRKNELYLKEKAVLLYMLHKHLVEDAALIDWEALYTTFKNDVSSYASLNVIWHKMKSKVRGHKLKTHSEIVNHLYKNYLPELLAECSLTKRDLKDYIKKNS